MGNIIEGFNARLGSIGSSIGSAASGFMSNTTATGAANASQSATVLATGLHAGADLMGGLGGYQMGVFQSRVAKNNAAIAERDSQNALAAGSAAESAQRIRTGQLVAAQTVAQAANGIDVGSGSAVATRDATAALGEIDALAIRYNATKAAYGYSTEQQNYLNESSMKRRQAGGLATKGLFAAGNSFLAGASSLGEKWANYKNTGAIT